jgi:hypothetical protein
MVSIQYLVLSLQLAAEAEAVVLQMLQNVAVLMAVLVAAVDSMQQQQ